VGDLHGVGVQGGQGAAEDAGVPHVGLGGAGGAPVADDDLQAALLGLPGGAPAEFGDVEETPVECAVRDRLGGVRRYHQCVAVEGADPDGYVVASGGP